jgi:hypothetical protein
MGETRYGKTPLKKEFSIFRFYSPYKKSFSSSAQSL